MRTTPRPSHRAQGFTLIELLVVISIIALLIAMLLPALEKARATAVQVQCAAQQRGIGIAMRAYANDFKGALPIATASFAHGGQVTWDDDFRGGFVHDYLQSSASKYAVRRLKCPANPFDPTTNSPNRDYTYNGNIAHWYSYSGPKPWVNLTFDMLERAQARYDAPWPILFDRISRKFDPDYSAYRSTSHNIGNATLEPTGGNVLWLDGSVEWLPWEESNWWPVSFQSQLHFPRDALTLKVGSGGSSDGVVSLWHRGLKQADWPNIATDASVRRDMAAAFQ